MGCKKVNINIDGLNIHYTDEGEGAPILLIHGWGSSIQPWTPILPGFSGYRVIALDLPGCGKSDILKEVWCLNDYTNFILKFIKALNIDNPILVGHSHGGRISIKLVADGNLCPDKLILFGSAGIPSKKTFKKRFKIRLFKTIKWALTLPVIKNYTQNLLESARGYFGSADYKSAPEVMRKTMVNVINTDLRDIMPQIKSSTLLIWGENDTETPLSDAKYMESHIKDSGLCVIKNAGHFAFCEKPWEVVAILKSFLN